MQSDAKLAKELYNKQFEQYSKKQAECAVVQDVKRIAYDLAGNITEKTVLFAGCGDGLECLPALEKGANVIGIDVSEKAIELAKKNCPNANFFVMDFEKLALQDKSADILISFLAVMYSKDLTLVLNEFKRVLKEQGFIILVVPHPVRKMVKYNNGNYFVKGKQYENWKGIERFNYYRLFEDYFEAFISCQLKVTQLLEPKPIKEAEETPDSEINYPHFLVFKLTQD